MIQLNKILTLHELNLQRKKKKRKPNIKNKYLVNNI